MIFQIKIVIDESPSPDGNYFKIMLKGGFELMIFSKKVHLITTGLNVIICFLGEELISILLHCRVCPYTSNIELNLQDSQLDKHNKPLKTKTV